jgi:hypothetical protein
LRHWGPIWGWCVFAAPYARWACIAAIRGTFPSIPQMITKRRRAVSSRDPASLSNSGADDHSI